MEYFYICDLCGNEYIERRNLDESQWFTKCSCGGNFIEKVIDETISE